MRHLFPALVVLFLRLASSHAVGQESFVSSFDSDAAVQKAASGETSLPTLRSRALQTNPTTPADPTTPAPACSGSDDVRVEVEVKLDEFPFETKWVLYDLCKDNGAKILESIEYTEDTDKFQVRTQSQCVASGRYNFVITDQCGDGIHDEFGIGYWKILLNSEEVEQKSGDSFTYQDEHVFNVGSGECPTDAPADAAIGSWNINFTSITANFTKSSTDEITLNYEIGKDRTPKVTLHPKGCGGDPLGESNGITFTDTTTPIEGDESHENLEVNVDVQKNATVLGANYVNNTLFLCAIVQLLSSNGGDAIKENRHNFEVKLQFNNTFDVDVNLDKISVGSDEASADVKGYIDVYVCRDSNGYTRKDGPLGEKENLFVCIESTSSDIQIDKLESLEIYQAATDQTYTFVSSYVTNILAAQSKKFDSSGMSIESVIPTKFFSYDGPSSISVSGVVILKFAGSERRLAVHLDGAGAGSEGEADTLALGSGRARVLQLQADEEEAAFSVNVELERAQSDLSDIVGTNGAVGTLMMSMSASGLVAAGLIGSAVAMMMW